MDLPDDLRALVLDVAREAVDRAVERAPAPALRPGTALGADAATGRTTVRLDGDDDAGAVPAQSLVGVPAPGARVMVLLVPPHGAYVLPANGNTVMPTGAVLPFAGTVAPAGWLLCDGALYVREDWPALFAVIGTAFGSTTADDFRVPDLRGRVPMGAGGVAAGRIPWGPYDAVGGGGGAAQEPLTAGQLPHHQHLAPVHLNDTLLGTWGGGPAQANAFSGTHHGSNGWTTTMSPAGNAEPVHRIQPSLVLSYLVKA